MRLFALPDGRVDSKDRAQWVTPPFDGSFLRLGGGSSVGTQPYRWTRYRLYQAVASPVLTPALELEEIDPDEYESGWRMPVRPRPRPIPTGDAPILTPDEEAEFVGPAEYESLWRTPRWAKKQPLHADGSWIGDAVLPADDLPISQRPWHVAFSEPVRPKFRAYYYPFAALELDTSQRPETVYPEAFTANYGQPQFLLSRRHRVALAPYLATEYEATLAAEAIEVSSFAVSFSVPVLRRRQAIMTPLTVIQLTQSDQGEVVMVCAWQPPMQRPVFLRLPVRPYLDGIVIAPEFFVIAGPVLFDSVMLAGGLHWGGF